MTLRKWLVIAILGVLIGTSLPENKVLAGADTTPPNMPSIHAVSDKTTAISGKAESKAHVFAYVESNRIGEATAKNGVYTIQVAKQKVGTRIKIFAIDAAKNKSKSKTITVVKADALKYEATGWVNMRSGASTSDKVITVLPKGTVVEYLGKTGLWYKVKIGTKTGFVSSAYLKSVTPDPVNRYAAPAAKASGTYVKGVLVVNKKYGLPASFNPGVDATAQKGVSAMVAAAAKQGIHLNPFSTFRSYSRQETLYTNYVAKYGRADADTFSARPGHSEHQSGLAFDFGGSDQAHWLKESFGGTIEGKWLAGNAHKYGFVLRYPKGKASITGYQYEPWHYRYVGSALAAKVKVSGKTLEEFLGVKGK
ncbi:D-alanyl-D-alanine carboxypeptidase family protein [Planococcus shixiaomingii]|uniref:D-alanyl-D-alanine carboxypeptidase family protein n=1 Tax=Planococcus shixiaomingii TaxID=3058393 RepID=UPI002605AF87|nr:D-alanyl-D-alanine carboxypeptidase family protein [Planococcus sp. N022]WKA53883.1 D-alanyl-D-alanine carboxypeptidase family protein [Planococcus sp. N022]